MAAPDSVGSPPGEGASSSSWRARRPRAPPGQHAAGWDSYPLVVTFTAEDVHRAELDEQPEWLADPRGFLAAWATSDAAVWHLPDVVRDFEHELLRERLDVKPLALNATVSEYVDHLSELTEAVETYRQRRTLPERFASASTVSCGARSGAWRETDAGRNPGFGDRPVRASVRNPLQERALGSGGPGTPPERGDEEPQNRHERDQDEVGATGPAANRSGPYVIVTS